MAMLPRNSPENATVTFTLHMSLVTSFTYGQNQEPGKK